MRRIPPKKRKKRKVEPRLQAEASKIGLDGKWAKFPLALKYEIILEWNMNCGVVDSKRWSKKDLAQELGMTIPEIEKQMQRMQSANASIIENKDAARERVMSMMTRIMKQLEDDRGRTVLHADILEKEITNVLGKLRAAEALPEGTPSDRATKKLLLNQYMNHFRMLSFHRLESLRTLFESTEATTKFIGLFSGQKGKNPSDKPGLSGLLDVSPKEEKKEDDYIDHKRAIQLLEEKQGQILPSQAVDNNKGVRNPNSGFEEFKNPEE